MEIVVVVGAVENVEISKSPLFWLFFGDFHLWNCSVKRLDEMWKAFLSHRGDFSRFLFHILSSFFPHTYTPLVNTLVNIPLKRGEIPPVCVDKCGKLCGKCGKECDFLVYLHLYFVLYLLNFPFKQRFRLYFSFHNVD